VNQEDSEQNEVDGMKKGADSTDEVTMLASCDGRSMTIRSVGNVGAALDVLMCSGHSSTSMSTKSINAVHDGQLLLSFRSLELFALFVHRYRQFYAPLIPLTPTVAIMGSCTNRVPDRVKPSFVIFDNRAL